MIAKPIRDNGYRHRPAPSGSQTGVRRWIAMLTQSVKDTVVDNGPQWAAAIAYYALLSAVPVMLCLAALVSYFVEPQWAVDRITNLLGDFVPQTEGTIEETVNGAIAARGQVGLLAFLALLWTGTRVFDSLTRAMNVAFDVDDDYSPLQRLAIQIAMLLTVGVFFLVALAAGLLIEPLWEALRGTPTDESLIITLLTWLLRVGLLLLAYVLLYRLVPRRTCAWSAVLAGAGTATVLVLVATGLFRVFVEWAGTYNLLYGSLAVFALIIVWVGIIAGVTVFGGEVVSHMQEMIIEGRSADEVGRRHAARSPRQRPLDGDVPDPRAAGDAIRARLS